MGYDLYNDGGSEFRLDIWAMPHVVELAQAYGWKPRGTKEHPAKRLGNIIAASYAERGGIAPLVNAGERGTIPGLPGLRGSKLDVHIPDDLAEALGAFAIPMSIDGNRVRFLPFPFDSDGHFSPLPAEDDRNIVVTKVEPRPGSYFHNEDQVVTADDARAWGQALRRAIPDLRRRLAQHGDSAAQSGAVRRPASPSGGPIYVAPSASREEAQRRAKPIFELETTDLLGKTKDELLPVHAHGPWIDYLEEFAAFCAEGQFYIG